MLKESIGHTLLSISPLETKGRYGQAGVKAVLKEFIGHPLLFISSFRDKEKGWTNKTKGSLKGVHRTPFIAY